MATKHRLSNTGTLITNTYFDEVTGNTIINLSSVITNNVSLTTDGLVFYVDARNSSSYNGTGNTWTDLSSSANNATLNNTPAYNPAGSGTFSYINFNGIDEDANVKTVSTNLNTFTICGQFRTTTASGKKIAGFENTQRGTGSFGYDKMVYVGTDGKLYGGVYKSGNIRTVTSLSTVTDGNWHTFALVSDSTNNLTTLYLDGVSQGSIAFANDLNNGVGWLRIASYKSNWTNGVDGYFTGDISYIAVYTKALSLSEVQNNNLATPQIFSYATLAKLLPKTETSNVITQLDEVSWPKIGSLTGFAANTKLIYYPNGFLNVLPSNFTIESWIYPTSNIANGQIILTQDDGKSNNQAFQVLLTPNNQVQFLYYTSNVRTSNAVITTSNTVTNNVWSHIAVVNRANNLTIFINGANSAYGLISPYYGYITVPSTYIGSFL